MSEKGSEPDIEARRFNVAEVPCVDGSRLASQKAPSPAADFIMPCDLVVQVATDGAPHPLSEVTRS